MAFCYSGLSWWRQPLNSILMKNEPELVEEMAACWATPGRGQDEPGTSYLVPPAGKVVFKKWWGDVKRTQKPLEGVPTRQIGGNMICPEEYWWQRIEVHQIYKNLWVHNDTKKLHWSSLVPIKGWIHYSESDKGKGKTTKLFHFSLSLPFFSAAPHSLRDFSSLTRDWTRALGNESTES